MQDSINKILQEGGVIAHPTDTCFGLAGDFMNEQALKKIQTIKGRDALKPMSIMLPLSKKAEIEKYGILSDFAKKVADQLLPGLVTFILPKGPQIPSFYFPETSLIGIRIPDDKMTQKILETFGGPLITTSANLSGHELCFTDDEVKREFENSKIQPDLILPGKCDCHQKASTVLEVLENSVRILREGPVTRETLEKTFKIPVE